MKAHLKNNTPGSPTFFLFCDARIVIISRLTFLFRPHSFTVTALNTSGQTCLHVAAESDLPTIASILLSNGADFAAVDQVLRSKNFISPHLLHIN